MAVFLWCYRQQERGVGFFPLTGWVRARFIPLPWLSVGESGRS
jgi:hypothetical protein